MRGLLSGVATGALVSVIGLGSLSVVLQTLAGRIGLDAPLVQAPDVDLVATDPQVGDTLTAPDADLTISTAPATPAIVQDPNPQEAADDDAEAPADQQNGDDARTDTATDDQPAPVQSDTQAVIIVQEDAPVVDDTNGDVTVAEPQDTPTQNDPAATTTNETTDETNLADTTADDETFVVDLEATTEDIASAIVPSTEPLIQLGGVNTLLDGRDTGVTIRRPGDTAVEDAPQTGDDSAPADAMTDASTATDALTRYAAPTNAPADVPRMSIILLDDGTMSAASAALARLPFAVSIAIDPALPNATDLMDAYRQAGFEVLATVRLPEGALPSDVEVTFESVFSQLPEAVGVLDIANSGLQADRDVTQQAMGVLADAGRGFVSQSQGLNMAGRAAEQAGVPAVTIYRDLDSDNQDARVVRRFVDQAAFRARQGGGVVLVGRVRPDTISALILWGAAHRDDLVAIVPVSAVLLGQ